MKASLALVLLAACDPIWNLEVHAKDPDGAPVAGAALSLTGCAQQNDKNVGSLADLTDETGTASVGGLGFTFPACDIALAKPGFAPFASSFDELCNGNIDDCERVQSIDVVLTPN